MRFRPANISLINRRHYLPRLLLTLFSKGQMQKPHQRFEDVDRVTPYQVRVARHLAGMPIFSLWLPVAASVVLTDCFCRSVIAFQLTPDQAVLVGL